MRVLCVAEKPSISKSITQILSGGRFTTVGFFYLTMTSPEICFIKEQHTVTIREEL